MLGGSSTLGRAATASSADRRRRWTSQAERRLQRFLRRSRRGRGCCARRTTAATAASPSRSPSAPSADRMRRHGDRCHGRPRRRAGGARSARACSSARRTVAWWSPARARGPTRAGARAGEHGVPARVGRHGGRAARAARDQRRAATRWHVAGGRTPAASFLRRFRGDCEHVADGSRRWRPDRCAVSFGVSGFPRRPRSPTSACTRCSTAGRRAPASSPSIATAQARVHRGMGLVSEGFAETGDRAPHRRRGDRPHALQHGRQHRARERAADASPHALRRRCPWRTTATSPTRRELRARARGSGRHLHVVDGLRGARAPHRALQRADDGRPDPRGAARGSRAPTACVIGCGREICTPCVTRAAGARWCIGRLGDGVDRRLRDLRPRHRGRHARRARCCPARSCAIDGGPASRRWRRCRQRRSPAASSSTCTSRGPTARSSAVGGSRCAARSAASWPREHPAPGADLVFAVPDSSNAVALGYREESGIQLEYGADPQSLRRPHLHQADAGASAIAKVKVKYNPVREVLEGRSVVMVDDSPRARHHQRGPRAAGARRRCARGAHARSARRPITGPCYYGIDTPDARGADRAPRTRVEEIRESPRRRLARLPLARRHAGGGRAAATASVTPASRAVPHRRSRRNCVQLAPRGPARRHRIGMTGSVTQPLVYFFGNGRADGTRR